MRNFTLPLAFALTLAACTSNAGAGPGPVPGTSLVNPTASTAPGGTTPATASTAPTAGTATPAAEMSLAEKFPLTGLKPDQKRRLVYKSTDKSSDKGTQAVVDTYELTNASGNSANVLVTRTRDGKPDLSRESKNIDIMQGIAIPFLYRDEAVTFNVEYPKVTKTTEEVKVEAGTFKAEKVSWGKSWTLWVVKPYVVKAEVRTPDYESDLQLSTIE